MIDRLFISTLAFAVIAGATLAIGGEFFSARPALHRPVVAELPRVVVTGEVQPARTDVASAEPRAKSGSPADRVQ